MILAAITTPHVDWLALSPALALLAAAAVCLLGAVLVPYRGRRIFSVVIAGAGFITPIAGEMRTMPGLNSKPGGERIDIDADGNVVGLF